MIDQHDVFIFDLDGTLSDPAQGITRSINYALHDHGFDEKPEHELCRYIGPPLDEGFSHLIPQADDALISGLIASYRVRYGDVGYRENILYEGIPELLQFLKGRGARLGVCTSKPERYAVPILEMFGLLPYFEFISGEEVGVKKGTQLSALLEQGKISDQSLMIGDRHYDVVAAKANNLHSVGVLWGHGSREELTNAQADYVFESIDAFKQRLAV